MNRGKYASHATALVLLLAVAAVALIGVGAEEPGSHGAPANGLAVQNPPPAAPNREPPAEMPEPARAARATTPVRVPATSTPASTVGAQPPIATPLAAGIPPLPSPSGVPESGLPVEEIVALSPDAEMPADQGVVIGHSVQGRPLVAYRLGTGPIKIVLVGDIHGDYESNTHLLMLGLLSHFRSHQGEVPEQVSLWLIPTVNPDGLAAGTRWNANGVDLNRNADTDLDGCAGNDWSPDTVGSEGSYPGAGGSYPFSEPETQALRDFVADAQAAVFYHSAAGAIYADSCMRHLPSAVLARALADGSGYPVPEDGWTGYRITGDMGDYLAGEGIAAVTVELTDHEGTELDRNLAGVLSLLAQVDQVTAAEAEEAGGDLVWLDDGVCTLPFAVDSLVHPLALEVISDTLYVLDSGRVMALEVGATGGESPCTVLGDGTAPVPELLLAPGDSVAGVRIVEPLDLAAGGGSTSSSAALFVLDRAGDVYRYDPSTASWTLERMGRPSLDSGDHYYVALSAWSSARFLLETTHERVWRFTQGQKGAAWADLALGRDVDLSATKESVYVLTRALNTPAGDLAMYRGGDGKQGVAKAVASFEPGITLAKPRQVVATGLGVFVLDRAGRRLLDLDPASGSLQVEYRFSDRRALSAFWANPGQDAGVTELALVLAGRDVLYFYPADLGTASKRERPPAIATGGTSPASNDGQLKALPNDPAWLESLRGLAMPIDGATITRRDYQMPGSPRHYRLGVHEGIDFYTATSGVTIDNHTPVRAVAAGKVIRALLDYVPLTAAQARAWAAEVTGAGYTPPDVLDGYRGRQVWIEHENGLISRYAHLSAIAPGIAAGAVVEQGEVIGLVGNSGTPESVSNPRGELHLHLELWAGEHCYVGQFLRPIEAREWIEGILR